MRPQALDLSTMMARVLLAFLTAASIVLLGLWLRTSDALGFVSTLLAVASSQMLTSTLRGDRVGPPTAASRRLQPILDVMADYPGGRQLGSRGFKRGLSALGIGFMVAIGATIVGNVLFSHATLAPLWRGTLALGVILLPVHLWLTWTRSAQQYTGTVFAGKMAAALQQACSPESKQSEIPSWRSVPPLIRVPLASVGKTALTLVNRVLIHLLIPTLFSTVLSILAVSVAVVTAIAGAPAFAAMGRSLRQPQTAAVEAKS